VQRSALCAHGRGALGGILVICLFCKKIRHVEGIWRPVDAYVRDHSDADFSHGPCSECMQRFSN